MKWKNTEIDGYPKDDGLVFVSNGKYIDAACWNSYHECWDDVSCDDYYLEKEAFKFWLAPPPLTDIGKDKE